jgi:hypothetical protein
MKPILASLGLVFFVSCATARLTSYQDPEFADIMFDHLAVYFPSDDLEARAYAENAIADSLTKRGSQATPIMAILPPTRKVGDGELKETLIKAGMDGVLAITDTRTAAQTHTTPTYFSYNAYTQTGYTYGGQSYNSYSTISQVELVDIRTGKVAWTGTVHGNGYDVKRIVGEMISLVTRTLVEKGVVSSARTPASSPPAH